MEPTFVDLFCGIGIGSLGFVKAGFKIVAAIDIDREACAIYETNLGFKPIAGDLRKISGSEILQQAGLKRGELSLCVGCPPCQGFSSLRATRLVKGQKDRRKSMLRVFAKRVEELLPKIVVLENVGGLTSSKNRRYLTEFVTRMQSLGYSCDYDVLDAADFGVAQHRKRLILIGVRDGSSSLPDSTHADPKAESKKPPWRTVRDVIQGLPPLAPGQKSEAVSLHEAASHSRPVLELMRRIPRNGGGRKDLPRRLWLPCHKRLDKKRNGGADSVYGRMRWDEPSPTITTRCNVPSCGRFVHPSQNRGITLREAARLQSIPDDFHVVGPKERVGQWIGNAFPLQLAEALGKHVIQYS
jgi:DNA (cytosine-5)-methyltransferase 1